MHLPIKVKAIGSTFKRISRNTETRITAMTPYEGDLVTLSTVDPREGMYAVMRPKKIWKDILPCYQSSRVYFVDLLTVAHRRPRSGRSDRTRTRHNVPRDAWEAVGHSRTFGCMLPDASFCLSFPRCRDAAVSNRNCKARSDRIGSLPWSTAPIRSNTRTTPGASAVMRWVSADPAANIPDCSASRVDIPMVGGVSSVRSLFTNRNQSYLCIARGW